MSVSSTTRRPGQLDGPGLIARARRRTRGRLYGARAIRGGSAIDASGSRIEPPEKNAPERAPASERVRRLGEEWAGRVACACPPAVRGPRRGVAASASRRAAAHAHTNSAPALRVLRSSKYRPDPPELQIGRTPQGHCAPRRPRPQSEQGPTLPARPFYRQRHPAWSAALLHSSQILDS
eukprot:scaffold32280_cov133-Isochrysis_galbana.AAC.5